MRALMCELQLFQRINENLELLTIGIYKILVKVLWEKPIT